MNTGNTRTHTVQIGLSCRSNQTYSRVKGKITKGNRIPRRKINDKIIEYSKDKKITS
jgi:hypothetical protein